MNYFLTVPFCRFATRTRWLRWELRFLLWCCCSWYCRRWRSTLPRERDGSPPVKKCVPEFSASATPAAEHMDTPVTVIAVEDQCIATEEAYRIEYGARFSPFILDLASFFACIIHVWCCMALLFHSLTTLVLVVCCCELRTVQHYRSIQFGSRLWNRATSLIFISNNLPWLFSGNGMITALMTDIKPPN